MATAAARQRKYRQRLARGLIVYHVAVGNDVLEAIIASGRLSEQAALDRAQCERVMADLLLEWAVKYFVTRHGP